MLLILSTLFFIAACKQEVKFEQQLLVTNTQSQLSLYFFQSTKMNDYKTLEFKSINQKDTHIFCFMGDGEQTKGPIFEAVRFIKKFNLSNITIVVDVNSQQLSGSTLKIMPMDIQKNYEANGFEVLNVNGHDLDDLKKGFSYAINSKNNVCILSNTVMGKGVKECEGTHEYHGKPLKDHKKAFLE